MTRDWNDPECPNCDMELQVHGHSNWDIEGFEMECPGCGETLFISVEVTAYEYEAEIND